MCRVLKFHRILERICCQKSFHTSQFLPLSIWLSRLQCADSAHSTLSRRHVSNQKMPKTSSMNYGQWGIFQRCLLYQCLTSSSIGYESYAIFECSTDTMGEISRTIFYCPSVSHALTLAPALTLSLSLSTSLIHIENDDAKAKFRGLFRFSSLFQLSPK